MRLRLAILISTVLFLLLSCDEENDTPAEPVREFDEVAADSESVFVMGQTIIAALDVDREAQKVTLIALAPEEDEYRLFPFVSDDRFDYFQNADRNQPWQVEIVYETATPGVTDTLEMEVIR